MLMNFDFGIVVTLPIEESTLELRLEEKKELILPNALSYTQGILAGFHIIVVKAAVEPLSPKGERFLLQHYKFIAPQAFKENFSLRPSSQRS